MKWTWASGAAGCTRGEARAALRPAGKRFCIFFLYACTAWAYSLLDGGNDAADGGKMETRLVRIVRGLTFEEATLHLGGGFANMDTESERFLVDLMETPALKGREFILMASHSMGGRHRTLREGVESRDIPVVPDGDRGRWECLREEDVCGLYYESATSGSSLEAVLRRGKTWDVILTVPFDPATGAPYRGQYWTAFHCAAPAADGYPDAGAIAKATEE